MTTTPLLGDVSLDYVQRIEHRLQGGFVSTPIVGLEGTLQQRMARPSHRIEVAGVLFGEGARDALAGLQAAAQAGEELSFAADITSALELQHVVITDFQVEESAAQPEHFRYRFSLAESPPLPPPAELSAFGGLGDFGVGDLGFDTDLLGDLEELASEVSGAVDAAMQAMEALEALGALDGLSLGGFLQPLDDSASEVGGLGESLGEALSGLSEIFGA